MSIGFEAMIAAAEREVRMRRSAYPRFVLARKMKQDRADLEIEAMEAIALTLRQVWASGWEAPERPNAEAFDAKDPRVVSK